MHLRNTLAKGMDAESYSLHTFEALLSQSMENLGNILLDLVIGICYRIVSYRKACAFYLWIFSCCFIRFFSFRIVRYSTANFYCFLLVFLVIDALI